MNMLAVGSKPQTKPKAMTQAVTHSWGRTRLKSGTLSLLRITTATSLLCSSKRILEAPKRPRLLPYKPSSPPPPLAKRHSSSTRRGKASERERERARGAAIMVGEKSQSEGLVLLDFWVSPFGQRCRIAMAEKGLPYEYLEQDLMGNKSDLLLRSNPVHKKVPVLLHAGRPVCESLIILQYLDEAFPATTPLLPADPYARAQARFWADYIDKKVYETGTRLWKLKGEPQQQARAEMLDILRTFDAELGDKDFFAGGDRPGFVDVTLVPFTSWFHSYEKYGGFSVEEECPRLAAWARCCGERDAVAKNLYSPEKVYDFIGALKKKYGVE